ncbi:hypothetical protein Tco_0554193 [Tanacetum coccineum]
METLEIKLEPLFHIGEAAYILRIKIYRDRSKRLIGICQSAYIDKILKIFRNDNSNRGNIPIQERLDLNRSQCASTPEEVKRMKKVLYALPVGSIMYAIMKFIYGLGIVPINIEPMKMYCDNYGAIIISNEPGVQNGARHYPRKYHDVHECIELGEINLLKVHTDDNLVDPFTKAFPKGKLTQHARSIGLRLASS